MENNRITQMQAVHAEALDLFRRKNQDYGDAFAKFGVVGVLVRMEDKLQRLITIERTGVHVVADERLRDTLIDLHNYAAMGVFLMDEAAAAAEAAVAKPASDREGGEFDR